MSLTTTCPWCGKDGVRVTIRRQNSELWASFTIKQGCVSPGGFLYISWSTNTRVAKDRRSTNAGIDKYRHDIERIIKAIAEENMNAKFRCMNGCCKSTTGQVSVFALLNRIIHGHGGSTREKLESVEEAV